jgi:hypothetical protein
MLQWAEWTSSSLAASTRHQAIRHYGAELARWNFCPEKEAVASLKPTLLSSLGEVPYGPVTNTTRKPRSVSVRAG